MSVKKKRTSKPGRGRIAECVIGCALFSVGCVLFGVSDWIRKTFDLNFQQVLYTVTSPLEGTDMGVVSRGLKACVPELICAAVFILAAVTVCLLQKRVRVSVVAEVFGRHGSLDILRSVRRLMTVLAIVAFVVGVRHADKTLAIGDHIKQYWDATTIYEERYVDPAAANITAPKEKKNLLYIYLESMETTYASDEVGGRQEVNYIPNLTRLAKENCSFSNSEQLGGWRVCQGATWTMGSLFATTSGIPFAFPPGFNSMSRYKYFASGCTTLGDVLEANGYRNVFLCGSDASFAGRRKYFEQHGNYDICDLFTARSEGYIPEDYKVWWGYEDEILYEIAKDKLTELAKSDQPFNLTMLTVDTHHIGGYMCSLCEDTYESVAANVITCADRQIEEFIRWCVRQDFYADTLIVVAGDHPRMDTELVEDVEYYDRPVYNCFLNCPLGDGARKENREFTAMDMFPSVLTALGFEYDGDRLGLGVDLFSDADTLTEIMGYDVFNDEISKYSPYYVSHFS